MFYLSQRRKGPKHTCSCACVFFWGTCVLFRSHEETKNTRFHFSIGTPLQTCESGGKLASEAPKEEKGMMLSCAHVVFVLAKKGP